MTNTNTKVDNYNYTKTIIDLLSEYENKSNNNDEIQKAKDAFHKALTHLELSLIPLSNLVKIKDLEKDTVIDTPSNENLGEDVFNFF
jgi:hypothetical protein